MSTKLVIGFIVYGDSTAKYLPYFLGSMKALKTYEGVEVKVVAVDNSAEENNRNIKYLCKYGVDFTWAGGNIGFAKAYNIMISRAVEVGADYFLVINPDLILEPNAVVKMVEALDNDNKLGSVCPKILKWDFKHNKKTNFIDTCGIKLRPGLRFVDAGQGGRDNGGCDCREIIGPSGSAGLYLLRALEKVKANGQYFDESMFMYKEDCDLAYRLFLAGYKSKCARDAVAYHDRTAKAGREGNIRVALNRKNKSRQIKKWSFLNQHIIFLKYWGRQNFANKLAVLWYALKMFIFVIFFEQYLFKQYLQLWKLRKKINQYGP